MFDSIFSFLMTGGIFMIPIGICSVVSLTVILERWMALRRVKVIGERVVEAIDSLHIGQKPSAVQMAVEEEGTSLSRLVSHCLKNLPYSKYENTETLQTKARSEISELDRGLVILEIIVGIGPLLGLLGTVSGLITIFGNVNQGAQLATQGATIARGIAEALNTTVAGLVVAIPSLIAHGIYSRKVEAFAVELESLCMDLLGKLYADNNATH